MTSSVPTGKSNSAPPSESSSVSRSPIPSPSGGIDGLTRLFESEHFNARMCVTYIFTYKNKESGILEYLVNKLHSYPLVEVEQFIPQLMCLLCWNTTPLPVVEQYVLTSSAKSINFALKMIWYLESDHSADRAKRVNLREQIEIAAINRALRSAKKPVMETPEEVEQEVLAKDRLCEYYNRVTTFIQQITELSLQLRKYPRSERQAKLVQDLGHLSASLPKFAINIPLGSSDVEFQRAVRIPASKSRVLNSRERAPYLIYIEYVEGGAPHDPPAIQQNESITQATDNNEEGNDENGADTDSDTPARTSTDDIMVDERYFHSQLINRERSKSPSPLESGSVTAKLDKVFGISWAQSVKEIKESSPFGNSRGWGVLPVIIKGGDDMRQEVLAMQLISSFDRIWREASLPVRLHPYGVVVTSNDSGIIELVTDATSIDCLKKAMPEDVRTLSDYWILTYGNTQSAAYVDAQRNFVESMAAYSVLSYLLQLKDRHNANILLRRDGSVVHIDFGFMLSNSPGGVNFESMPFKLSQEFVDVMGGVSGDMFQYFRVLVYAAFKEAMKHKDEIIKVVDMMIPGPLLPCFGNDPKAAVDALASRLSPDGDLTVWVRDAVDQSVDNWFVLFFFSFFVNNITCSPRKRKKKKKKNRRARGYDRFQKWSNGIL